MALRNGGRCHAYRMVRTPAIANASTSRFLRLNLSLMEIMEPPDSLVCRRRRRRNTRRAQHCQHKPQGDCGCDCRDYLEQVVVGEHIGFPSGLLDEELGTFGGTSRWIRHEASNGPAKLC